MNYKFSSEKNTAMKNSVFVILLSILLLIISSLTLPWYTTVVAVNDYFYSVSKAGMQVGGVLPVVIPLLGLLVWLAAKPKSGLTILRLKIIFFAGLWVTLYASCYYCSIILNDYTTPGIGALTAIVGGIVLMLICVIKYTQKIDLS